MEEHMIVLMEQQEGVVEELLGLMGGQELIVKPQQIILEE